MARPIKTGLDYFSHDTDASSDEKIELLRAEFGNDAYAFYFISLERIYKTENGELSLSTIAERKVLSKKIGITLKKFDKILEKSLKINLFDEEIFLRNSSLTSKGIKKRFLEIQSQRERKREQYSKKKDENKMVSDVVSPEFQTAEMGGEIQQSKLNESKEKNSNVKHSVESDDVIRLTNQLLSFLKDHDPHFITPDLESWNKEMSLLITEDGRAPEDIERIIKWALVDEFWRTNILGVKELRKHFPKLYAKEQTKPLKDYSFTELTEYLKKENEIKSIMEKDSIIKEELIKIMEYLPGEGKNKWNRSYYYNEASRRYYKKTGKEEIIRF